MKILAVRGGGDEIIVTVTLMGESEITATCIKSLKS